MLSSFDVRVLSVATCGDILTVRLSRPPGFEFKPAQWLRLTVPGVRDDTRTFTIASAPADDWLEITTRRSVSEFKVALAALEHDSQVSIAGPGGRLRLPDGAQAVAFVVGGVGITPVRSILRDAVGRGQVFDDAVVIYGNRDPECVPYSSELEALDAWGVRVAHIYESAPASWSGPRGFISADLVRSLVDPHDGRPFVVAGPPAMVDAMIKVLDELEIEPARRIVESFGSVGQATTQNG